MSRGMERRLAAIEHTLGEGERSALACELDADKILAALAAIAAADGHDGSAPIDRHDFVNRLRVARDLPPLP